MQRRRLYNRTPKEEHAMSGEAELSGPDLTQGVATAELAEGRPLLGHAGGEPVLLIRKGEELFAVGATCTHYGGPLAEGLVVGDTVRCPWHHACFSLRTGAPLRPPALNPIDCWRIERRGTRIYVREKQAPLPPPNLELRAPGSIVIVGSGAAGNCAAETLRTEGYTGSIVMVSTDP